MYREKERERVGGGGGGQLGGGGTRQNCRLCHTNVVYIW